MYVRVPTCICVLLCTCEYCVFVNVCVSVYVRLVIPSNVNYSLAIMLITV